MIICRTASSAVRQRRRLAHQPRLISDIGSCCQILPVPPKLKCYHGVGLTPALARTVREDLLSCRVAEQIQVPSGPPRRHEPLTLAEPSAFPAEARTFINSEAHKLALRLDMRRGELLGPHWSEIDYDTNTPTIHRTVQRINSRGLVEIPRARTLRPRIPPPPPCIKVLKEHERFQEGQRGRAGKNWMETDHAFTTSIGAPLDPGSSPQTSTPTPVRIQKVTES